MKKCLWVSVLLLVGIYLSSFAWSQESENRVISQSELSLDSSTTVISETDFYPEYSKINIGETVTITAYLKTGTQQYKWNDEAWKEATTNIFKWTVLLGSEKNFTITLYTRGTYGEETLVKKDCVLVCYQNNSFLGQSLIKCYTGISIPFNIKFTKTNDFYKFNTGEVDGEWKPVVSSQTTLYSSYAQLGTFYPTVYFKDSSENITQLTGTIKILGEETTTFNWIYDKNSHIQYHTFLAPGVTEYCYAMGTGYQGDSFTLGTNFQGWKTATNQYSAFTVSWPNRGNYPVYLYYRDSYGEHTIMKRVYAPVDRPYSDFNTAAHPQQGYAPLFTNLSLAWGSGDSWRLTLGEYSYSYSNPRYVYGYPADYMIVGNNLNISTTHYLYMFYSQRPSGIGPYGGYSDSINLRNYVQVFARSSTAKTIELPTVKLFPNETKSSVVNLSNYRPYDQSFVSFIGQNFLNLAYLTGDTINYSGYGSATSGEVHYGLSYYNDPIRLIKQKVQISTYKMIGLPEIILSQGESTTLNLRDYTYNSSGKALASSFGKTNSLFNSCQSCVSTQWVGSLLSGYTALRITTLSGFTADSYLDIVASPSTILPSGNQDIGRVMLKPRKLASGKFNSLSEFQQQFVIQTINDYPLPPVSVQVPAPDTLQISFSSASEGFRIIPALGNFMDYQKGKWYKATMQARTLQNNNFVEAHLFNMKGVVPGDLHVEGSYNMVLGIGTTWTPIDGYLYVHQSGKGYPIIQLKNQGGTAADVILKDIAVIESEPPLARLYNMEKKNHDRYYSILTNSFYPDIMNYWGFEGNAETFWINDRGIYGRFTQSTVANVLKMTAIKRPGVLHTPSVTPGNPIGMRTRVINSDLNIDYEDMFMMAAMGVQREGEFNIWEKGNQILASYEFGNVTDETDPDSQGWHYIANNALNPYYQYQIFAKTNYGNQIFLEDMEFIQCIPDELN